MTFTNEIVGCPVFLWTEKKKENGEDWGVYRITDAAAAAGVFDGCGGSGARICSRCNNKTEAYLASRIVGKAFDRWACGSALTIEALKTEIDKSLREGCEEYADKVQLMGSIQKSFPTTLAAFRCTADGAGSVIADIFWAGDSRVYLLDEDGLAQITEDDLGGIDAMENLTADGILTNVVSAGQNYTIHGVRILVERPSLLFAATDGCFGYLRSPMEFEYLLLKSIIETGNSVNAMEKQLARDLGEKAGDDYTLSGFWFGVQSQIAAAAMLRRRYDEMYEQYILGTEKAGISEIEEMWKRYQANYHRLLCHVPVV